MNKTICNNCGKCGHVFHQCRVPITSCGIIVFRYSTFGIQYIMIRRKDSFGYIDFIRGKYALKEPRNIVNRIDEMSNAEKLKLQNSTFHEMWNELWGENSATMRYRSDEAGAQRKFDILKNGENAEISLTTLLERSKTNWSETEWEFPKGRRNYQEKDIDCATREFEEETGYKRSLITIVENVIPYEEIFMGSNGKCYKNKYFIGFMNTDLALPIAFQRSEVSKVEWKNLNGCIDAIRPYNLEKIEVIKNIDKLISNSFLCNIDEN